MTQAGIVIENKGDTAVVEFQRSDACSSCGKCGMGMEAAVRLELTNTLGAANGDCVNVEMHSGKLAGASFLAYILPLFAFLAGLWAGDSIALALSVPIPAEVFSMLTGLVLTAAAYALIRLTERRRTESGAFSPKMVSVTKLHK